MWREYNNDKIKFKRTSFPPLVEPTGLFSLTIQGVSRTNNPRKPTSRTNTHNSRFEFRRWHSLKHTDFKITQCK